MFHSRIFEDMPPEVIQDCGYFKPKSPFIPLDYSDNLVVNRGKKITAQTKVLYFPGSFGMFHRGHQEVVNSYMEKYGTNHADVAVVISPANSDYLVEKYGAWSNAASNQYRYGYLRGFQDWMIDLEPMLNFDCDHNFTDLLENFLNRFGLSIDTMEVPPVILCGKDRSDFKNLEQYTDKVEVFYAEQYGNYSTSAKLNAIGTRSKKHLYLRCHKKEELELFTEYFHDQYVAITPLWIKDEFARLKPFIGKANCYTICKDYKDVLPYIPLSRQWINPLEQSGEFIHSQFPSGVELIVDSDVYSGSTKKYLESKGFLTAAVYDLSHQTDTFELLDIDDFRKVNFRYPHVDISSRCSMQAFDHDFHGRFDEFVYDLSGIRKEQQ